MSYTTVARPAFGVPAGTHPDFAHGFRGQPLHYYETPSSRKKFGDGRDFENYPEH